MADNMSVSNPSIPLFKGENYEFWSIKMVTLFKSHGLWDLVNNGIPDPNPNQQENEKEDARALFYIQLAVHDTIFSKITAATNAKEAWTTLKIAFQGSTRVMAIKLQDLRRDFETLQMNKEETIQVFLSRVQTVVNQIRVFGDTMEEKIVVVKVLRSLTPKFDHVVAAIEESKNLDVYSFDELMGSLQTHESRMSKTEDKGDEKAFYMKRESLRGGYNPSRGWANSNRGGRGQGRSKQTDCYNKQREENQANHTEKDKQLTLFMISNLINKVDASDIREFENKLESLSTVVEELLLSQERKLAHFVSDQGTSNASSLSGFMQDHEAEDPKKVGSAAQNGEVASTPMVDCNGESVIEEPSSPKKKTEHPFSVIKKSTKTKEAEPKSDESDSSTPVPELGSMPKMGRASTTKKVVNAKKEIIERPRAKRRKRRPRAKRKKKRRRLPNLMEIITNKEVYEIKTNLELKILNQEGVLRIDSKYI
jgi:gag-polypeptide of LTR copia-type